MRKIQDAVRIQAIAFLRQCQGDGVGCARSQRRQKRVTVAWRKQRLAQHSHDAIPGAGAQCFHGIKTILPCQRIRHIGPLQRGTNNAPITARREDGVFGEHGLMGAVKGADPQMHDAGLQCGRIERRACDRRRKTLQRRSVQSHSR